MESKSLKQWILSGQIALFGFLFFTARGVPTDESLRIVAIIASQIYVGAEIWKLFVKNHRVQLIELLGMGFAFGSAIFTIIDQILIRSDLQLNDSVIPIVLVSLTVLFKSRPQIGSFSIDYLQDIPQATVFMVLCVFLGFGELTHGSLLAVVILIGLFLTSLNWARTMWKELIISTVGVCGSIFLYSQFKPPIAYGSWFLRPLYTGTDDAVFSESVAYSVAHFGSSEYAAAQGTNLRYHWFSLAWSGMVDRVASTSPFTMTLHVVPVVTFSVIALLLLAIGIRLGMNSKLIFLAPCILFATSSAPGPIRFFYFDDLNTTNVLPFVWTLALTLIVVLYCMSQIRFANLLIAFFSAVILLSKIPFAVAPIAGLTCLHLYNVIKDFKKLKESVIQLVITAITLSLTFVVFLTPTKWERRQFNVDWNLMHIAHDSKYRFIIAPLFILIFFITRFPLFLIFKKSSSNIRIKVFLLGASFTGLFRFVLNGATAELFFLTSALIFGSIAVAIVLTDFVGEKMPLANRTCWAIGLASAVISFISINIWDRVSAAHGLSRFGVFSITFPFIISCLLALIFSIRTSKDGLRQQHAAVLFTIFVCLIFGSTGVFLAQSTKTPTYMSFGSIATEEDINSLNWLRNNSNVDAVIATNRGICTGTDPCGFDDSSFLISAVAHRRVLIEGPRFVTGGRPYPDWVNDRIQKSLAFANSPSLASLYDLKNMGVTWYVMDTNYLSDSAISSNASWGEWAELVHQESNILILKLRS